MINPGSHIHSLCFMSFADEYGVFVMGPTNENVALEARCMAYGDASGAFVTWAYY